MKKRRKIKAIKKLIKSKTKIFIIKVFPGSYFSFYSHSQVYDSNLIAELCFLNKIFVCKTTSKFLFPQSSFSSSIVCVIKVGKSLKAVVVG